MAVKKVWRPWLGRLIISSFHRLPPMPKPVPSLSYMFNPRPPSPSASILVLSPLAAPVKFLFHGSSSLRSFGYLLVVTILWFFIFLFFFKKKLIWRCLRSLRQSRRINGASPRPYCITLWRFVLIRMLALFPCIYFYFSFGCGCYGFLEHSNEESMTLSYNAPLHGQRMFLTERDVQWLAESLKKKVMWID